VSLDCAVCGIAIDDDEEHHSIDGVSVCTDVDACVTRWVTKIRQESERTRARLGFDTPRIEIRHG
jgi:hypothetical protein